MVAVTPMMGPRQNPGGWPGWAKSLLIKIYSPQPLIKLMQYPFFQNSCLTSDSKIRLSNRKGKIL